MGPVQGRVLERWSATENVTEVSERSEKKGWSTGKLRKTSWSVGNLIKIGWSARQKNRWSAGALERYEKKGLERWSAVTPKQTSKIRHAENRKHHETFLS